MTVNGFENMMSMTRWYYIFSYKALFATLKLAYIYIYFLNIIIVNVVKY